MTLKNKKLMLAVAFIGAAGVIFFWPNSAEAPEAKPSSTSRASSSTPVPPTSAAPPAPHAVLPVATSPSGALPAGEQDGESTHEAKAVAQIEAAAVTYAPSGIDTIAPFLLDASPVVRQNAIDGLIRLGETGGASALREAAAKAKDPRDAIKMLDAADYLELPPAKNLSKLRAKKQKSPRRIPDGNTPTKDGG
jgi:hypothetical protein